MRRLAVAVVLLCAVATVARAGGRGPSGVPAGVSAGRSPERTNVAAVQKVLDARVAAVRNGDRNAFLATVDPQAPQSFMDSQAQLLGGLHSLPLDVYRLVAREQDTGDLSTGLSARYGGAQVFLPETRQVLRLTGYDESDDVESLWLTFVQRSGRWYVASSTDLQGVGLHSSVGLWDFGPVVVHPTPHFLAMSHPADANRLDALAAVGAQAMSDLHARWPLPWSERIPMVLPGSVTELAAIIQSTVDLSKFVAFTAYSDIRDDGYANTAARIYIQDTTLSQYPPAYQLRTLVHELDHAAVAPIGGPIIPSWVHEGVADWVGTGALPTEHKPAGSDGVLPRDDEFGAGSATSIQMAYAESRSAISYLARRSGQDAPARLFQALGQLRVTAGDSDYWVDEVMRRLFGISFAEFQAAWAAGR